jgi:hypothetical protein
MPYLMATKSLNIHTEHADSPHYLATTTSGLLLTRLADLIKSTISPESIEKIL